MARYFLDSSALVKHYHQESGSPAVEGLFNQPGDKLFVSGLALVEVHSAFAQACSRRRYHRAGFCKSHRADAIRCIRRHINSLRRYHPTT